MGPCCKLFILAMLFANVGLSRSSNHETRESDLCWKDPVLQKNKTKQNKKYCQSVKDTKRPFRRIALYCGGR